MTTTASISLGSDASKSAVEINAFWLPVPDLSMELDVGQTVKQMLGENKPRTVINIIIRDDATSSEPKENEDGKIARFCEKVYVLSDVGEIRQGIDVIFQTINKVLNRCSFQLCDKILGEVNVQRLSSPLMVGFLSITLASKEFLVARPNFYARVHEKLVEERGLEAANRLLNKYK
jgi:hypothetical protein